MVKMFETTNSIGLTLLHKCNFHCAHCAYLWVGDTDDHAIKPGYRLTWEQIQTFISDCRSIEDKTFSVVMNGGEPTLWEEEDRKFIDVALAIAEGGIHPTFNTNGSYFVDYNQCYDFYHRYAEEGKLPLITFVSVDKFHDNYDREKGRAVCLDNIKKVLDEMPADKRAMHRINVITIVSKDPDSFLPEGMKEYYEASSIKFGDVPLMPMGRAKALMDEVPDMSDFFKNAPPPPRDFVYDVGTLVGEYYRRGDKDAAKLGHLKELLDADAVNA